MARNLKYQFKTIIEKNFKEGVSKHSLKAQGKGEQTRVFSYAERKNLIDISSKFANYMKDNHSDVNLIRDLKSEHIQEFLNQNANGWTKATIDVRCSQLAKLEKLASQTFKGSNFTFYRDIVKPTGKDPSRTLSMSRSDYNKLLLSTRESKSDSRHAVEFAGRFGLRVSETTKLQYRDIQRQEDGSYKLNIVDSKGGRDRTIEITKEADKVFLEQFKGSSTDRIIPLKTDSVNKFVNRHMHKCQLNQYIDRKTSIHSMRKMVAQEEFDKHRADGLSRQESLDKVSNFLGHGENRNELMERYVANIY